MNEERLLEAVRVARQIDCREFAMETWRCGTTACVIGHCANDRWFRANGLTAGVSGEPVCDGKRSWDAVEKFFDIASETSHHLFDHEHYEEPLCDISPEMVAQRIEAFVASVNCTKSVREAITQSIERRPEPCLTERP